MEEFDVFLAHNSLDKPLIIEIARHLKQKGLNPWLDKEQILGGDKIIQAVFNGISLSKTGAFFIGKNGLGNFQANLELDTVIHSFLERQSQNFRVIPVLLPGVSNVPQELWYLKQWRWIQFTKANDEDALDDLIRSIKGGATEIKAPVIQVLDTPPVVQPTPPKTPEPEKDDLASEKGINYTRLRDLLAAKNWKEADKETYLVMIKAIGKKDGDYFNSDELLNFPCTDLRTIDRLWVKYSNGHFGFRVQKEIYLSLGGKADGKYYKEAWEKFGDRVGWRVKSSWINYDIVTFDTSSPRGHLPVLRSRRGSIWVDLHGFVKRGLAGVFFVGSLLSHRDL
ncbi:GUN4 domain-containing protein [Nostoc sp. FACHB-87]|uniref:GUN4 domain-containing protein n=1 Tax=Nostocaceae TaxID=1162 RepID=UPI00168645B4|nr:MULTISPECIES: GUN4 domain-containing protein [Nostocaceae]MBD2458969.1 GUN4 domain-containing protein [Nostoc sp. FACHB-87]MBD2480133.1 GUN4 domain-containing protein [Anabaena sp. FACHB-83]